MFILKVSLLFRQCKNYRIFEKILLAIKILCCNFEKYLEKGHYNAYSHFIMRHKKILLQKKMFIEILNNIISWCTETLLYFITFKQIYKIFWCPLQTLYFLVLNKYNKFVICWIFNAYASSSFRIQEHIYHLRKRSIPSDTLKYLI